MNRRREIDHRLLIHELNRRYHREWQRAERLERDLALCGRWVGPVLAWLRRCKHWLCPASGDPERFLDHPPCPRIEEGNEPARGRVSVIIPFKDRVSLLKVCLHSLRRSEHADREVILVDNGSTTRAMHRYLVRLTVRGYTIVQSPQPFNFSRLCNEGARQASGDYLLFLNNDTEVLTPDWLTRMVRLASRVDIGIVGATLLYPDGTIQHAGLYPVRDGRWVHGHRGRRLTEAGEWCQVRAVPAVTGACLLVRRDLFHRLGGFDESLPVTYSDVDLCCRVRAQGLHIAITPHARLLHFEGMSRGFTVDEPGQAHLAALTGFPAPGRARKE